MIPPMVLNVSPGVGCSFTSIALLFRKKTPWARPSSSTPCGRGAPGGTG